MKTENQAGSLPPTKSFRKFSRWMLLGAVAFASVALATGALRGNGRFDGYVTITPATNGVAELNFNLHGIVTHLGRSSVRLHSVVDFSGPLPTPVPPTTGVITAANGDTLSFNVRWTVSEVSPGVFDTVGPFTITGGTGRFVGATGGGDYRGHVDTNNGGVTAAISGTVVR